jgi:hypothetical protein
LTNPAGGLPCALRLQTLGLYLNLIEALCHGPEFQGQSKALIEQEVIAIAAFNALNRTIDNIAKLQYFLTTSQGLIEK